METRTDPIADESDPRATEAAGPTATDRRQGAERMVGRRVQRANSALAEGLANGFVEASLAFSDEVQGSSSCGDVIESAAAGLLRANGRFLAELGTAVRRMSDELADGRAEWGAAVTRSNNIDYDKLADLVAARMTVMQATPSSATDVAAGIDYERLADLVSARLADSKDT
jgi:hypothetical protein